MLLLILIISWVSMIVMNYFTINLLSSTRAYINGESYYARSHKNASRNLLLYTNYEDPHYYQKFEKQIYIPIQDSIARVMLFRNQDRDSINQILLKAGNSPDNINDFLWLGKTIYHFPYLTRALKEWKESDVLIGQLHRLGQEIRAKSIQNTLNTKEKHFYSNRIDLICEALIRREANFSNILNNGINQINFWVYLANLIIIVAIFGSSILKSGLLINSISTTKKELELKNEMLSTTNEELDKFVYSASHDLRSPLASLKGLIYLAKEEKDINELRYYLNLMLESIEKQDKFIRDIIDFSRNKKTPKKVEAINLEALIDESVNQHIYYYKDTEIEIKKEIFIKEIITDPVRLRIILNNLISNAIKYRDPKKPVTLIKILTYENENYYCLDVIDNGIGIEHDELPKVFDMFFVSADNHIGTGLGLYIAKESIIKLGGKIEVNSHKGMGTKFCICLPKKQIEIDIEEPLKSRALS